MYSQPKILAYMHYLKYYSCNHDPELQKQVVRRRIICAQVYETEIVVQTVQEGRSQIKSQNWKIQLIE